MNPHLRSVLFLILCMGWLGNLVMPAQSSPVPERLGRSPRSDLEARGYGDEVASSSSGASSRAPFSLTGDLESKRNPVLMRYEYLVKALNDGKETLDDAEFRRRLDAILQSDQAQNDRPRKADIDMPYVDVPEDADNFFVLDQDSLKAMESDRLVFLLNQHSDKRALRTQLIHELAKRASEQGETWADWKFWRSNTFHNGQTRSQVRNEFAWLDWIISQYNVPSVDLFKEMRVPL